MKKFFFCFLFTALSSSYSRAENTIIVPDKVTQGQQLIVDYKAENYNNSYLEFNGKSYQIFSEKTFLPVSPELKTGGYTLKLKVDNQEISSAKVEILKGKFGHENISFYKPKLSKEQEELIKNEDKLVEETKVKISDKQLWDSPFILPVPHRVSALYGTQRYLNGKYNGYHSGVDFASPFGFPVKAINNANVSLARYFSKYNSNGNLIFLDHGAGVGSVYLHLSKIAVKEGDYVKKGQTIGYIGSSGRSTGPHIHWGVYLYGQNTDGLSWTKLTQKLFSEK